MNIKKSVVLGALVLLALYILVSFGNWQVRRLAWKEALIARIDRRIHQDPVPLLSLLGRPEFRHSEYQPVTVRGYFRHDHEYHFYQLNSQGRPGWHIYTLFEYKVLGRMHSCSDKALIFVNRGFVSNARKEASSRARGQIEQPLSITGLLRKLSRRKASWFTPGNDVNRNMWYSRSFFQLRNRLPKEVRPCLSPYVIDLQKPRPVGGWPQPGVTRINFPNNHLGYIITWYGLALALLGVYGFFLYGQLKKTAADKSPEDKKTEGQAPKGQAEEDEQ